VLAPGEKAALRTTKRTDVKQYSINEMDHVPVIEVQASLPWQCDRIPQIPVVMLKLSFEATGAAMGCTERRLQLPKCQAAYTNAAISTLTFQQQWMRLHYEPIPSLN
jgi:hypothetical protein